MFLPILEYIHIPSDEGEAAALLSVLVEARADIAIQVQQVRAVAGSARTVLETLVEDGSLGRISDSEARCYNEEIDRYEAEERENRGCPS